MPLRTPSERTCAAARAAAPPTYVYWADRTTVGTILQAPKTGGGATILARDANPTAIAVDGKAVYWSDQDGYIKSAPK